MSRIFLSPPCISEEERRQVAAAFDSGYVAPCGPMVDEFERRVAALAGRKYAVAVSSGTAAIDLAMAEWGVDSSWTVVAPSLTFIATVGPAYHRGARCVFVDSDATGNMDLALLETALHEECGGGGKAKVAVVSVDLYGRCCDYGRLEKICERHGARLLVDAAEALGAFAPGTMRPAGSGGEMAVFSFNGNKIVTTSGGGALLTDDAGVAARARKRSQQSREPVPWYEHVEVGYNYRMSNILAGLGLAQLRRLPEFLARRAEIKTEYRERLSGTLQFLPPVDGENNWLTVALAPSERQRDNFLSRLADADIEARPVWKPLHMQSVFAGCKTYGGAVSEDLFRRGLCLPSGSGMGGRDVSRVVCALVCNRVLVLGRGRSGRAAENLLARMDYDVATLDGEDAFPGMEFTARMAFAVVSPGVPPSHRWLEACERLSIPVKSELQLGVEALRRRGVKMLAVTGSKGKSSVVKLVAEALGGVPCGNYGLPVSELAARPDADLPEWAVVEVSSFQLERTALPPDAFEAAAILNLQEDHLDRHGSVEVYHALKRRLLGMARISFDCAAPDACELLAGSYFDNPVLRANGSIAAALMRAAGLGDERIKAAFAAFVPLPHRMNVLGRFGGVVCIDDSKATSIAALAAAVRMSPPGTLRLIAGGLPKGDDAKLALSPLRERVRKVYTIGQAAEAFALAWSGAVPCEVCGTLDKAVAVAMREAAEGDVLLLSPGAASFDQFQNFEERGDVFASLVKQKKEEDRK